MRYILGNGNKTVGTAIGTITVLALFLSWTMATTSDVIPARFLPSPWRVAQSAIDLQPSIFVHAAYTLALVLVGFTLGALSGLFVGLLMRRSFVAKSMLTPIVESWRPVPVVAIIPFFILWFGFAWHGKAFLVAIATFLIVVIGVLEAIDRVDPLYIRVALSFGADRSSLVDKILLPAIFPTMLGAFRIALATSVTVAVVSEFMGATRGIGHVINTAMNTFSTHTIVLCTIVLGLIGAGLDWLLRTFYKRFVRWASYADDAVQTQLPQ